MVFQGNSDNIWHMHLLLILFKKIELCHLQYNLLHLPKSGKLNKNKVGLIQKSNNKVLKISVVWKLRKFAFQEYVTNYLGLRISL